VINLVRKNSLVLLLR